MQSQTQIFSCLVDEFFRPGPLIVSPDTTVREALAAMTENRASHALVADSQRGLVGIFTERDVTRRVALRCEGSEPITAMMTTPVRSIKRSDYLYRAIAKMRRFDLRHMPIVDEGNQPVGIINLHDAIAFAASQMLGQIDRLTQEGTLDGLREIKTAQVEVAEQWFADHLPAPEVQSLLTHINNDIYLRIVEQTLSDMHREEFGKPPAEFEAIVMGSGGRGENFLYPDQDNGFVVADYPDDEHTRIDRFFIELAERMTRDLAAVGFPMCKGHVMATNPVWRKTLPQWRAQTTGWFAKRSTFAAQLSDIFFDFQPVYGDGRLSRSLRAHVAGLCRQNPVVLQEMFTAETERHVALGLFGRLRTERDQPENRGKINLKYGGLLPLVGSVRLLALRVGIEETPTLRRVDSLHRTGVLTDDEADEMRSAFNLITGLLLQQQLRDYRDGKKVGNFVHLHNLPRRQKKLLKGSLKAVDSLQKKVRMEFTGEIF